MNVVIPALAFSHGCCCHVITNKEEFWTLESQSELLYRQNLLQCARLA